MVPSKGAPAGTSANRVDRGRFLIFVGGDQIGSEDFELTATGARSVVEISEGGHTSRAEIGLLLSPQIEVESYQLDAPGVQLRVAFEDGVAKFDAPGLARRMKVNRPLVILEDNVFSHYQILLGMYEHLGKGMQSLMAIVPSAGTSVPVTMESLGPGSPGFRREVAPEGSIPLNEYKIVVAGVMGVSMSVDGAGRVMCVQMPGRNCTAMREEYRKAVGGVKPVASTKSAASGCVDQDVALERAHGVRLSGTLTLPAPGMNRGARHPAVVLISGSGPQDRDGNTPQSCPTFIFRRIAQRLAEKGIAVLRYDNWGAGESTGNLESAGLFDLAGDARAMVAFLKRHPSIDRARIGVVGYSEGAYIASMLAGEDPQIAACVIMAGASKTMDEVMMEQIECQATCRELDEASRSFAAGLLPAAVQFVQDARDGKESSAAPGNLKWLREHMQIDPVAQLCAVRAPILIVQGEKDLKVKQYHAHVLAEAARKAGNRSVTLVCLPNTTHEFLEWPYRNPNFDPMDPARIVEGLLTTVSDWLASIV